MKMKKILLNILISLIIVGGITIGNGMAQGVAPNIKVSLAMDKLIYLLDNPGTPAVDPDRIKMVLTFKNNGGNVYTPKGFSERLFHLQLVFTDPDGKIITANGLGGTIEGEPGPPPVIPVNGQLLQAEPVETLPNGWVLSITIPDAHAYYSLTKAGRYSVKARIPMRTYPDPVTHPEIYQTVDGVLYAKLDSFDWADALGSNTVYFAIVADADKDGYYYPVPYGQHTQADCDDNNPNVNPGMTEIPGNGIDDDCDPSTSDGAVTQMTLLKPNGGEVIPSGSTYLIRWAAPSNAVKFDLKYSMNNGTTWKSIANKITGTTYNWRVPKPTANKPNCLVKVIAYDSSGMKVGEDTSDKVFTIEVIKVTSPDGGEVLESRKEWTITWKTYGTVRPVANAYLYYSRDGGATWKLITTCPGNPQWYTWKVPLVATKKTSCKVKVILKDALGNPVGSDVSDKVFTIHP